MTLIAAVAQTCYVAKIEKRHYIGIDENAEAIAICKQRLGV